MNQYTARLVPPYPGLPVQWVLYPTNAVWLQPWWRFKHRHLAVQFAARRGIRIEVTP